MNVIEELRRIERDILPAPWTAAVGTINTLVLSVGRLTIASLGWNTRAEDARHARAIVVMRNSHAVLLRVAEKAIAWRDADHPLVEMAAHRELMAALAELEALEL